MARSSLISGGDGRGQLRGRYDIATRRVDRDPIVSRKKPVRPEERYSKDFACCSTWSQIFCVICALMPPPPKP